MDLSKIAARVARLRTASEYDEMLDDYMNRLADADSFLNVVRDKTPSPEGKVIVTGLHQDLFQLIADARGWVQKLKFMGRSKPGP